MVEFVMDSFKNVMDCGYTDSNSIQCPTPGLDALPRVDLWTKALVDSVDSSSDFASIGATYTSLACAMLNSFPDEASLANMLWYIYGSEYPGAGEDIEPHDTPEEWWTMFISQKHLVNPALLEQLYYEEVGTEGEMRERRRTIMVIYLVSSVMCFAQYVGNSALDVLRGDRGRPYGASSDLSEPTPSTERTVFSESAAVDVDDVQTPRPGDYSYRANVDSSAPTALAQVDLQAQCRCFSEQLREQGHDLAGRLDRVEQCMNRLMDSLEQRLDSVE